MIIIHPGTHKTGTSSLQKFLHENRGELGTTGWHYSNISRNHSGPLCSLFKNNSFKYFYYKKHKKMDAWGIFNENKKVKVTITQELQQFNQIILSGEDLSFLTVDELHRMKAFLNKYHKDIKIILYYREPQSYICSAMQQHLKGGGVIPKILISPPKYQFYNAYSNYKSVFGENSCLTRPYEDIINGSIVDDFFNTLGLSCDFKINEKGDDSKVNVGLSRAACYILNIFNIADSRKLNMSELEVISELDPAPFRLELSWKKYVDKYYEEFDLDFNYGDIACAADWFVSKDFANKFVTTYFSEDVDFKNLVSFILDNSGNSELFTRKLVQLIMDIKQKRRLS